MNILRLERFFLIDIKGSDSIETIRLKFANSLNLSDFWTASESNGINFKMKKRSTDKGSAPEQIRVAAFKVFQEGHLDIFIENNKLNINWAVELDHLYFLSVLIGLASGFTSGLYFNLPLFSQIIAGLIVTICSVIIGILAIMSRIDEINTACLE